MLASTINITKVSDYQYVLGNGVGEKPRNLERYRNLIHSAGFKTNRQLIIGSDIIDKIIATGSDLELRNNLLNNIKDFSDPLLVRSAAISGDALGIGIYKSYFTNKKEILRHILSIISQFNNEESKRYRRLNGINTGLSISVESIIGNRIKHNDQEWIAPLIAGSANSASTSGAYLTVGSGLGFTLMTNPSDGITVFKKDVTTWHSRLSNHFLVKEYGRMFCSQDAKTLRITGHNCDFFDLSFAFEGLNKLQLTENPVYIEYAVAGTAKKPEFYITQIAEDIPVKDEDAMHFIRQYPANGLINLTGDVQGAARFDCNHILFLPNHLIQREEALKALQDFNNLGKPYILMINSEFLHTSKYLPESFFSNAKLIIGVDFRSDNFHQARISTHVTQRIRQSKVVSVGINLNQQKVPSIIDWYQQARGASHMVISSNFEVAGSELSAFQGRLVVVNRSPLEIQKFTV